MEALLGNAVLVPLLLRLVKLDDDEEEALECTKEQRPDSLLESLFEVLAELLLAFVEDRFTSVRFVKAPLIEFSGVVVESTTAFESLKLSLRTTS